MKKNSSLITTVLTALLLLLNLQLAAQTDSTGTKKLPLAVLELKARNQDALIVVEWTTIDEEGLSHYVLQYSSDGKTYKDILLHHLADLPAGGNSDVPLVQDNR